MPNPVVHWEIVSSAKGKDLQQFYATLFGWELDTNNEFDYGLVNTRTERGINGGIGPTEGPSRITIYAEVDDLQAYLDTAVELGGTVVMPITEIPGVVTMALFADPDGNVMGLIRSDADGAAEAHEAYDAEPEVEPEVEPEAEPEVEPEVEPQSGAEAAAEVLETEAQE